eukprot:6335687-Prymnesium_polylepis.1
MGILVAERTVACKLSLAGGLEVVAGEAAALEKEGCQQYRGCREAKSACDRIGLRRVVATQRRVAPGDHRE